MMQVLDCLYQVRSHHCMYYPSVILVPGRRARHQHYHHQKSMTNLEQPPYSGPKVLQAARHARRQHIANRDLQMLAGAKPRQKDLEATPSGTPLIGSMSPPRALGLGR